MDVSIFLAKVLGLYLFFISLSMIINGATFSSVINDMLGNPSLSLLTGIIALILGILLVVSHNIWVMDWRVIITITAWMSLFKGITRTLFPLFAAAWLKSYMQNKNAYFVTAIVTFILSLILIYFGFYSL